MPLSYFLRFVQTNCFKSTPTFIINPVKLMLNHENLWLVNTIIPYLFSKWAIFWLLMFLTSYSKRLDPEVEERHCFLFSSQFFMASPKMNSYKCLRRLQVVPCISPHENEAAWYHVWWSVSLESRWGINLLKLVHRSPKNSPKLCFFYSKGWRFIFEKL